MQIVVKSGAYSVKHQINEDTVISSDCILDVQAYNAVGDVNISLKFILILSL